SREGFRVSTGLSGRHVKDNPFGATLQFQLADSLRIQGANRRAERKPHRLRRALRQFDQEQMESRSDDNGSLGTADLGRDDDRVCWAHSLQSEFAGYCASIADNYKGTKTQSH